MRYRVWLVIGSLALLSTGAWASEAAAQASPTRVVGDSSTLTIDVVPLHAEVRLNGAPLGIAHDLVSRAIPVAPGTHVVEVSAPGYLTSMVDVGADVDWATRIWLQLIPDRNK